MVPTAMDQVTIINVIHGSRIEANYTHDGYLCHIAIPAPQGKNRSSRVRYEGEGANYEELHDTTSLCQICRVDVRCVESMSDVWRPNYEEL